LSVIFAKNKQLATSYIDRLYCTYDINISFTSGAIQANVPTNVDRFAVPSEIRAQPTSTI